jgi:ribosomal protein L40E
LNKASTNNISKENANGIVESRLKQFFHHMLKDSKISQVDDIKGIANWYHKKDTDKKGMVSSIVDKMGNELAEHVTIPYIESLTKKLEFNTENKEISINNPVEIGLFDTDIHPYIEFGKVVSQVKVQSIKFKFHLNLITRIKKITAKRDGKDLVFDIQKLGIELKLMLIRIDIYSVNESMATNPLKAPISIGHDTLEIDHIVLSTKDSKVKFTESKQQLDENSQSIINGVVCVNCNNNNPENSVFCNRCGSKINLGPSSSIENKLKYDESMKQNNKFNDEVNQINNRDKRIKKYTSEGKPIFE